MRNYIFRTLLTLALAVFTLPMLSQDFMIIYLKNGDIRKFYMENITEIAASKVDTEGIQHSNYCSQSITTIYDTYVYNIEDVDSITFTKIDEEKAEQNFVTAMPEIFSVINKCGTIEDVEDKIDQIKNVEGVANAWSDGHELHVSLKEGETFSFHLNHGFKIDSESIENMIAQVRAKNPKLTNITNDNGTRLKAVIANQLDKDESLNNEKESLQTLQALLDFFGIDAYYEPNPTIEFFYEKSKDPEHPHFFDCDIVFLISHGKYGSIKHLIRFIDIKKARTLATGHSFMTSEDIDIYNDDDWKSHYAKFKKWRKNSSFRDITDLYINYDFSPEVRGGKEVYVAHPVLTEFFFKDITKEKFDNPNSILFNSACQSLMGDDPDNPSYSLAEILFDKHNLGIYAGYTHTNHSGREAGREFFVNLLAGKSVERSYEDLYEWLKEESEQNIEKDVMGFISYYGYKGLLSARHEKKVYENAKLKIFDKTGNMPKDIFLLSPHTKEISAEEANKEYNQTRAITVTGDINIFNYNDADIKFGFELIYYDPVTNTRHIDANVVSAHNIGNNTYKVEFKAIFNNLERNRYYSYRAYTYDGMSYNYGKTCEFKIDQQEELAELTLSTTGPLNLEVGESTTVEITSGNGDYIIENRAPSKVSVKRNDNILTITAISAGDATIIVTDTKTGQTQKITVEVKNSEPSSGWVNLISNGDMEGTGVSCFFERTGTYEIDPYHATISNGVGKDGSRGIKVAATARQKEDYDNQFWFRLNEPVSADTKVRISFDYRADKEALVRSEAHGELGDYIDWTRFRYDDYFTPQWQHFSYEGEISPDNSTAEKPLRSVAFSLSLYAGANNYYFDNIKFEIYKESEEPVADLKLSSTDPISLKVGESKSFTITSGSGNYNVKINPEGVATLSRNGNSITIKAVSAGDATITVTDTKSGQTKTIKVTVSANPTSFTGCPDDHHPHFIDLGLPSGTQWRCCNEGAAKPEDFGGYYKFGQVANVPSREQCQELVSNCTSEWTTVNGVNGRIVYGSNGNSIFFPAAGILGNGEYYGIGEWSYNWTSTKQENEFGIESNYGYGLVFGTEYVWVDNSWECDFAFSVRPINSGNQQSIPDLELSTYSLTLEVGTTGTVQITSGSGRYSVKSNSDDTATASIDGDKVIIKAINAGPATITVTDTKSGQTKAIKVNVTSSGNTPDNTIINFADPNVKAICIEHWDTNGDGELSKSEAAAVSGLPLWAFTSRNISSFNEFQYFTGLKSIRWRSFESCSNLTSIIIPNAVTTIEGSAFRDCEKLSSLTIGNSVTSIGEEAFENCSSLTSISIPNSVKNIGDFSFSDCTSLTSITIPNSVTSIGDGAFAFCESLTSATIGNNVKNIESQAFYECGMLSSVAIGSSVTTIGEEAFSGCYSLTSIAIPKSVTTIESRAFDDCRNLKKVVSYIIEPFKISSNVFRYVPTDATLYVPKGTKSKYEATEGWNIFKNIEEM